MANHAGTTPMTLRNDALVKAARFIMRVRQVVMETDPHMVGTVGHLEVQPNAMNVVPGRVALTLELRGLREDLLESVYQMLMEEFRKDIVSCRLTMEQPCFHMSETVQQSVRNGTCGDDYGQRSRSRQHEPLAGDEGRHDFCPKRQGNQPQQRGVHDVGRCDQWSKCPLARPV